MVSKVIVLGGGSAGFMAALALKVRLPELRVLVIRSKDIGIIGVGEGSTVALTLFLHDYLKVGLKKFHEVAQPTWKLGLKFLWGPRPYFHYTFGTGLTDRIVTLPKQNAFYCDEQMEYEDPLSSLMTHDRAFDRGPGGGPRFHNAIAYHFENEKYVNFLEGYAAARGVEILDDTVEDVRRDESGLAGLALKSGRAESADLYVDCSGFVSLLLGKTLQEPFVSFKDSLFCDRAVVGGWDRKDSPDPIDQVIKPYTTCETMPSGWAWQIEHEQRINRGYVYCSSFVGDAEAEAEFRSNNPKVGPTRVVRFVTGRYERAWVKNVVAIGNATGFVEPLEATALGVIAMQSRLLADSLADTDRQPRATTAAEYNDHHARSWDSIRAFIAVHYRYNTRLDTPFWRHCREHTDLTPRGQRVVDVYREHGPTSFWEPTLFDPFDPFKMIGYIALLQGQRVHYHKTYSQADSDLKIWNAQRQKYRDAATRALTVREALAAIRSPSWKWS